MGKRPASAAEARALANPLRLRILRLCLDEARTNKQIADGLGRDPGTTLHHVRLLVETGFLAAEEVRHGTTGALEKPYRATGKSWVLDVDDVDDRAGLNLATVDAFREELAAQPGPVITMARMGLRLGPQDVAELEQRLNEVVTDFKERDRPQGEPIGVFIAVHHRS
jgi:DNA-binding transcriptional ArsR family regulator